MIKSLKKIYPMYIFTDLILTSLSFFIPFILKYNLLKDAFIKLNLPNFKEYSFVFILWVIFILIVFNRRNLYATDRGLSIPKEIFKVIGGILNTAILIGTVIFFAKYKFFSREVFIESFILLCILLSAWRIIKRVILRRLISEGFHNINVLIVGGGKVGKIVLGEIKRIPWLGLKVVGFLDDKIEGAIDNIPVLGKIKDFSVVARRSFIDELIITIPSERGVVAGLIKNAQNHRLGLRIVAENFEEPTPALDISYLGILSLLTYKERKHHPAEFALKRLFDFSTSLIFLILLSPLFLIIAILIKLDSPGPVFYIKKRSGFKGRIFNFYKFRSMVKEADELKTSLADKNESKGNIIFKIRRDPRITRIGRFLRRYSLDEFPQLINVLKGDMSLVGPRPFPVEESQKFEYDHMERLTVKPGITGLAQIRGRSDLSFYRWVKWDLWYVNNWSFGLDFLILWWTTPIVLKGKGAY
ncbi:MAG: sugar transferase [Candidatus Omnitrophica bacterium]|nr:sugar transferase [Candidatus Omnitrophota bacterium]